MRCLCVEYTVRNACNEISFMYGWKFNSMYNRTSFCIPIKSTNGYLFGYRMHVTRRIESSIQIKWRYSASEPTDIRHVGLRLGFITICRMYIDSLAESLYIVYIVEKAIEVDQSFMESTRWKMRKNAWGNVGAVWMVLLTPNNNLEYCATGFLIAYVRMNFSKPCYKKFDWRYYLLLGRIITVSAT